MSYIKKEPLLQIAKELQGKVFGAPLIVREIENAPEEDVVEVARCKDCMWWHTGGCAFRSDCGNELPEANDFCSHAERKINNDR